MSSAIGLALLLYACIFNGSSDASVIQIDTQRAIAEVDERFLSFTFDASGWRGFDLGGVDNATAGLYGETLDVLISGLAPAVLRVGGTQQDYDVYADFGPGSINCSKIPVPPMTSYRCKEVTKAQWTSLLAFVKRNRLDLVFGLNDMYDRPTKTSPEQSQCGGGECPPRNQSNIEALLRWTFEEGRPDGAGSIWGFEIGNELNTVLGDDVGSATQASDARSLRDFIQSLNVSASVLGPDPHSYAQFQASGLEWIHNYANVSSSMGAIDTFTFHEYCLGDGRKMNASNLKASYLNATALDKCGNGVVAIREQLSAANDGVTIWAGETAAANNGGHSNITDTFIDGFWFADQLGQMSKLGVAVHLRQVFLASGGYPLVEVVRGAEENIRTVRSVGATRPFQQWNRVVQQDNFTRFDPSLGALLDADTLVVLPDYFVALLFKRLVGTQVLNISSPDDDVRLYAYCSKKADASVVLTYVHLKEDASTLLVLPDVLASAPFRVEYILEPGTPLEGAENRLQSKEILLNGELLKLFTKNGTRLPETNGKRVDQGFSEGASLELPASTFGFFLFPTSDESAPACAQ